MPGQGLLIDTALLKIAGHLLTFQKIDRIRSVGSRVHREIHFQGQGQIAVLKAVDGLVAGLDVLQQAAQGTVDDHVKGPIAQGQALPLLDLLGFPESVIDQNEVVALAGRQVDLAAGLLANKFLAAFAEGLFQSGLAAGWQTGTVAHQLGYVVERSGRLQMLLAQNIQVGGQHQAFLTQEDGMAQLLLQGPPDRGLAGRTGAVEQQQHRRQIASQHRQSEQNEEQEQHLAVQFLTWKSFSVFRPSIRDGPYVRTHELNKTPICSP